MLKAINTLTGKVKAALGQPALAAAAASAPQPNPVEQLPTPERERNRGGSAAMAFRAARSLAQRGGTSLSVGLTKEQRAAIPNLGSKAGDTSRKLYAGAGLKRFESFLIFAGWPNAEIAEPWYWLDDDFQPIDGIFEQFFAWLEEEMQAGRDQDGNQLMVATFDTVIKWAQDTVSCAASGSNRA